MGAAVRLRWAPVQKHAARGPRVHRLPAGGLFEPSGLHSSVNLFLAATLHLRVDPEAVGRAIAREGLAGDAVAVSRNDPQERLCRLCWSVCRRRARTFLFRVGQSVLPPAVPSGVRLSARAPVARRVRLPPRRNGALASNAYYSDVLPRVVY